MGIGVPSNWGSLCIQWKLEKITRIIRHWVGSSPPWIRLHHSELHSLSKSNICNEICSIIAWFIYINYIILIHDYLCMVNMGVTIIHRSYIYIYIYIPPICNNIHTYIDYSYYMIINTYRIHGAGIYANIGGILMGSMWPYIAAPWILWNMLVGGLEHEFYFSIYWEFHHPNWLNWLSYFSEGWVETTNQMASFAFHHM